MSKGQIADGKSRILQEIIKKVYYNIKYNDLDEADKNFTELKFLH